MEDMPLLYPEQKANGHLVNPPMTPIDPVFAEPIILMEFTVFAAAETKKAERLINKALKDVPGFPELEEIAFKIFTHIRTCRRILNGLASSHDTFQGQTATEYTLRPAVVKELKSIHDRNEEAEKIGDIYIEGSLSQRVLDRAKMWKPPYPSDKWYGDYLNEVAHAYGVAGEYAGNVKDVLKEVRRVVDENTPDLPPLPKPVKELKGLLWAIAAVAAVGGGIYAVSKLN